MTIPDITVRIPVASPADLENNRQAVMAALHAMGQVRIRLNLDVYAPGTPSMPRSRYYCLCGSSPTIVCRTGKAVEYALGRIRDIVVELNGWAAGQENGGENVRPIVVQTGE